MSKNTFIPTTKGLVSAHKSQDFTSDQKTQARTNIAAAASTHTHSADDIVSGALAKARQHAQTVYLDALSQTFVNSIATLGGLTVGESVAVDGNIEVDGDATFGGTTILNGASVFNAATCFKTGTWHTSTEGTPKQRFYFDIDGTTYFQGHGSTPIILRNGDGSDVLSLASTHEVSFGANGLKIHSDSTGPWIQSYSSKPLRLNPLGNEVMFTDNHWIQSTGGVNRINFTASGATYLQGYGSTPFVLRNGSDEDIVTISSTGAATFNGTITAQSGRPVKTYSGYTTYYGDAGGYIIGNRFRGPSDTDLGMIGVVGNGDNLYTYFIGNYADEIVTFSNVTKAATFNGAVTVNGFLNIGSTDCRMFRDSGNLYIESDGSFNLRDTSTAASLWALANDGRTFSKTNVWHSDSDGNARILYNGSGGATNFNDAYNFVSSTRGHGLKSDGTIVWGGSQDTNNRGALSWNALDKAVITVPEKLDISAGGAARYLATSHWFNLGATFNGEVLSYGDTNGTHTLLNRNDYNGSSAYSRLALVAYGNSWGIGMGSSTNNSNALEIREDALGANALRFKMDIGGAATFSSTAKLGDYTVATLPSAASNAGHEANVTDSSVTTFGSTVAGGGSSNVKVRSNGTNWTVTGI